METSAPVDLSQVGGDLAVGQALRGERQDHLVDAGQPALTLLDDLRCERSLAVPRHIDLDRADVRDNRPGPPAVPRVAAVLARGIVPVIAEVVRHLAFEGGLQEPLRQLLEQPAIAGQLQALGLSPGHELIQEPVIHARRHGLRLGRCRYVLAGHRCNPP